MLHYPYIPNSNEAVRKEMLDFIGAESVEEIYAFIPDETAAGSSRTFYIGNGSEKACGQYFNEGQHL